MTVFLVAFRDTPSALELFEPGANAVYSLEVAAELARVPRRVLLVYSRAGLVRPVLQPPYGMLAFTEEAIHTVRRIEHLRAVHGLDAAPLAALLRLLVEVERLRARASC